MVHSSTCRHRLETASTVCAACLRNQLSAILSDRFPDPRIERSRSCSADSAGFEDSVENAAERCLKSCHVEVEKVSVGELGVNEDVDVRVRWKGRDRAGRDARRGFDDDLDWGFGDEVKTTKELMSDDWKSKKKKEATWMNNKKTKKDEKEGDSRGFFWKKASGIRERFSKWKIRMKGSRASGDDSSIDGGDLSNAVVKQREDLTEMRASKNKIQRRSCDAVLFSEGRGSFDSSPGLAGKPRLSLDVNLVERSCQFQKLRLEVSNVSDAAGIDNSVPKRLEKEGTWKLVGRSGISQDARVQDSDNGSEGIVAPRLRRRFNRMITNMKVLSPLPVKKGRETSSSRPSPSGTRPISKLLITEKELLEWSSKTRDCEASSLSH